MSRIEVGHPYVEGKTSWAETSQYAYRAGCHVLELFLNRPTHEELNAVRDERLTAAFYAEGDLIILLYRFGDALPWADSPFSYHLVASQEQSIPPEAPLPIDLHRKTHIVVLAAGDEAEANILLGAADLTTVLIAADTGIVRAIRTDQFSVQFTWALNAAIREQVAKPWPGAAAYDRQLRNLYQRFPSPAELITVAQAICVSEQP